MIPTESTGSKALAYLQQKGITYTLNGGDQAVLDCAYCGKLEHFYINASGTKQDGLWDCKVCGEAGNLYKLMDKLGDRTEGLMSMKDVAMMGRTPEPLPNVDAAHNRLLEDEDALEYLVGTRGFTMKVIERMKLGVEEAEGKRWLLIPYFRKGNLVFVKKRTLPPAAKEFRGTFGREASLYNEDALVDGMEEIVFVEGEPDALAVLSMGYENVVAVPGANLKKAAWIARLDHAAPKRIYLLYDRDQVGQKAAHEMAARIGIEKVYNIALPPFDKVGGGEGKDVNEWFCAGHTLEEFQELKAAAKPFDVDGVTGAGEALGELEDIFTNKGSQPTLVTMWQSVNDKIGGFEYGDLIGIIAEGKVGKTTMIENQLWDYAKQGYTSFLYCGEMPPVRLARKLVSHIMQVDDSPGKSHLTLAHIHDAKDIIASIPGDMLFGYTRNLSSETVFNTIRQAVRRYGVKIVAFDNLQLMSRRIDHQSQELSVLTKMFKELAMELNILIFLIVQPNRVKEGEIVAARNAMGSSAIEKDVDAMIALHRNRIAKVKADDFQGFLDTEENFEPQMLVRVDLSRYAPGGVTTLWMDGATSTVREFNPNELNNIPRPVFGAAIQQEQLQAV